jgi:hypothetical protein
MTGMVDWMAIVVACALAALIGLGFVLWESYENERLARGRLRRRVRRRPRPKPIDVDVDDRAA